MMSLDFGRRRVAARSPPWRSHAIAARDYLAAWHRPCAAGAPVGVPFRTTRSRQPGSARRGGQRRRRNHRQQLGLRRLGRSDDRHFGSDCAVRCGLGRVRVEPAPRRVARLQTTVSASRQRHGRTRGGWPGRIPMGSAELDPGGLSLARHVDDKLVAYRRQRLHIASVSPSTGMSTSSTGMNSLSSRLRLLDRSLSLLACPNINSPVVPRVLPQAFVDRVTSREP